MYKHVVFRIIAGIFLLLALAGIAFFAYQAGTMHAVSPQGITPGNEMPFYPFYWHPFFGFGFLGVLIPLVFLFLAFAALRHLIWGPRWYRGHMHHHGPWYGDGPWQENGSMGGHGPMGGHMGHHGPWGEDVPPMFSEWHRRVHNTPGWDKTPDTDKKE